MRIRLALALLLGLTASCAEDGPKVTVNYAPGFVKDGLHISIFGVFRDGRMNPEAWDDLGPRFSAVLHKDLCEAAIDNTLRASNAPLYAAVDSVARADGITDELLDKFAPAANGDSILVIMVAGHPPHAKDGGVGEVVGTTETTAAQMRGGGGARPGRRSSAPRTNPAPHGDRGVFEVSASLFSKRQHQSVAMVSMTSKGPTEEEAIKKFVEKLSAAFPGATCAGWNADVGLDAAAVQQLAEP